MTWPMVSRMLLMNMKLELINMNKKPRDLKTQLLMLKVIFQTLKFSSKKFYMYKKLILNKISSTFKTILLKTDKPFLMPPM